MLLCRSTGWIWCSVLSQWLGLTEDRVQCRALALVMLNLLVLLPEIYLERLLTRLEMLYGTNCVS